MKKDFSFDSHVAEYEQWFDDHSFVFKSEVEALRAMLPRGDSLSGIEVALGTGRFCEALGIKEGVEPSAKCHEHEIKSEISIW